jgi:hypothetical protein
MIRVVELITAGVVAAPFAIGTAVAGDRAAVEFRFRDLQIIESSGLVARDGLFVTVNDSGDRGRTFVVDPTTGRTVGGVTWSEQPDDVEAIAPAPDGSLVVGDIGDNAESRDSITVLEVPFGREAADVDPRTFTFTYPDGPRDAETLLAHPVTGRVFVVSKNLLGGTMYAAPAELSETGANELEPVGDVLGFATDGAFFPDGRHFVLRDYGSAVVYSYPGLEVIGDLRLPDQQQGEGIAVDEDGAVFVCTEGQRSPVHRVALPSGIARAVGQASATSPPSVSATPSTTPPAPSGDQPPGEDGPEEVVVQRPEWMWWLGGIVGIGIIVVLIRSLRPR